MTQIEVWTLILRLFQRPNFKFCDAILHAGHLIHEAWEATPPEWQRTQGSRRRIAFDSNDINRIYHVSLSLCHCMFIFTNSHDSPECSQSWWKALGSQSYLHNSSHFTEEKHDEMLIWRCRKPSLYRQVSIMSSSSLISSGAVTSWNRTSEHRNIIDTWISDKTFPETISLWSKRKGTVLISRHRHIAARNYHGQVPATRVVPGNVRSPESPLRSGDQRTWPTRFSCRNPSAGRRRAGTPGGFTKTREAHQQQQNKFSLKSKDSQQELTVIHSGLPLADQGALPMSPTDHKRPPGDQWSCSLNKRLRHSGPARWS